MDANPPAPLLQGDSAALTNAEASLTGRVNEYTPSGKGHHPAAAPVSAMAADGSRPDQLAETPPPDGEDGMPASRELGPHMVTSYASAPEAERYRRIMRVFVLNKTRDLDWRLTPDQVAAKVRDAFGLELDQVTMERALAQLEEWGALTEENDSSDATNAREFRRKRFTYDITPAAERLELLLNELDSLVEEVGSLESSRLPGIRDAVAKIAAALRDGNPDPVRLREELEYLVNAIGFLRGGAAQFMSRVGAIVAAAEAINETDFNAYKASLIEHLEGFHRALRIHSEEIIRELGRITADQEDTLVELIAGVDAAPTLIGVDPEEAAARRRNDIRGQWHGVRSWFTGDTHQQQTWNVLNAKVLEAIQAVLDIAERIIDRAANRADRASAWEYLAGLANASNERRASEWFAVAVGAVYPRHFNTPETDTEQLARPAQTTWAQAPPAPVATFLRRPGARTPGAGRGSPLRDNQAAAEHARQRRETERREIQALIDRFAGRGPIALADVGQLSSVEFGHVMDWIARAFESRAEPDGSRAAESLDLRLLVSLQAPADHAERTVLHTTWGTLRLPNYTLEVVEA